MVTICRVFVFIQLIFIRGWAVKFVNDSVQGKHECVLFDPCDNQSGDFDSKNELILLPSDDEDELGSADAKQGTVINYEEPNDEEERLKDVEMENESIQETNSIGSSSQGRDSHGDEEDGELEDQNEYGPCLRNVSAPSYPKIFIATLVAFKIVQHDQSSTIRHKFTPEEVAAIFGMDRMNMIEVVEDGLLLIATQIGQVYLRSHDGLNTVYIN